MSSSATKLERATAEQAIREIVEQLLGELGNPGALEEFARKESGAHLERDLGLGSLERVELMLRLDKYFSVHLPETVVAEADTVSDLAQAVLQQTGRAQSDSHYDAVSAAPNVVRQAGCQGIAEELREKLARAETLTEIIGIRGRADADAAHIYLCEEDGGARTITCGELFTRATAVAAELTRRGIAPGQTVAIMLPTSAEFFWTFAGTLLAGAIPVPIYPPFRADRIEEYAARQAAILRNAEARLLVTFRRAESVAKLLEPQVKSLRAVVTAERLASSGGPVAPPESETRPVEIASHRARADEIALLQYTSGSTGNPKGVVLTHVNLLANIRSMREAVHIHEDDVAVSWLPLYHDMGLIGAWFVPLATRIPVAILSPLAFLSRPERWLWAIHNHRGTLSPAPNFAYELCVRKIAETDIKGLDLSSWRAALNGAEPVRAETIDRFVEKFSPYGFRREALLPVYGLAEASLGVAAPAVGSGARVDQINRTRFENEGRAISVADDTASVIEFVSAGKPLPQMEVRIVNAAGQDAGERVEGRLFFRGPSATSGYYRNPEATRELVREDGWLDSGDLAYLADDEVYITGRAKDIIIKGGHNLYPQEIEEIAGRVKGVRTGCVVAFGVPDKTSGTERLAVAAEARDLREQERIAQDITREVSEALGLPPDIVVIIPAHSIPKTSSGKLRRSETRKLYLEGKLTKAPAPAWLQIGKLLAHGAFPRAVSAAKKVGRRGTEILYGVYALALFGIATFLVWAFLIPTRSRNFSAGVVHRASRILLRLAAIRVQIEGSKVLSEWTHSAPWIFAPNHSSYLDILTLLAILPARARYVAKGEIASMPLVNLIARRSGHFAFERASAQARIAQAEEVNEALRQGDSVVIYPEGTFTEIPGIRPFQLGAFKAAVDTGRPICPIALRGARELLRDKTYLPKPGRVTITFGPLIYPRAGESDWHEIVRLRDETREVIAQGAGESLL
ncbi:MAG TPA: AMP-binding protein [Candidatus Acidoferrales bacterium]|nr:AMP-binding protein [Candidatus Acidoferrales bacterium]